MPGTPELRVTHTFWTDTVGGGLGGPRNWIPGSSSMCVIRPPPAFNMPNIRPALITRKDRTPQVRPCNSHFKSNLLLPSNICIPVHALLNCPIVLVLMPRGEGAHSPIIDFAVSRGTAAAFAPCLLKHHTVTQASHSQGHKLTGRSWECCAGTATWLMTTDLSGLRTL